MKGLFMRYLHVKYQHPIPNSSKDIAQVKVFSLRCDTDADTGVMTITLRTVVPANKNLLTVSNTLLTAIDIIPYTSLVGGLYDKKVEFARLQRETKFPYNKFSHKKF
jgi:hypothetical protein